MNATDNASADSEFALHTTVDVMSLRLRARDDLSISLQVYGGETCYLIEDPLSSRFYRIGVSEYTLLSLCDGDRTIAEAMAMTATLTGRDAMSETDTVAFCKWLVDSELAVTIQSTTGGRLAESSQQGRERRAASRVSPLHQRLPLSRPDDLLEHFRPIGDWLFSPLGASLWLAILLLGACSLWIRWDDLAAANARVLSPHNWLHLVATWLTLKLIHESAHAFACKRYGGEVREAGILLILLAPLPYVDVTSAWRFDSKWKRMVVSAAGMAAELGLAAIAAWIWTQTDSATVQQTAVNVMLTATVMTLVFNANPLMRFDGYYLLADWLELPNLATHGSQWLRHSVRRLLFGGPPIRPVWPRKRTPWIATYGILALLWRVFVCITLVIVAEAMFFGAGVVLALLAIATWVVVPLAKFVNELRSCPSVASRKRAASLLGILGATGACVWMMMPYYSRITAPAVVDYWPVTEVRSSVEGFVKEVAATEGELVSAGDVLVQLHNPELELEAGRLRVEMEKSQRRSRAYAASSELAALQVEQRNRDALAARVEKIEHELAALTVRAQHDGKVIDSPLRWREGALVLPGAALASVGEHKHKRIQIMVPQRLLHFFQGQVEQPLQAHLWGLGGTEVRLQRVHPRGATQLLHPALASFAGGPLAVRQKGLPAPNTTEDHEESPASGNEGWELLEPHFLAVATGKAVQTARPGQTGFVSFWRYEGTLGKVLMHRFVRWTQDRRNQAKQAWERQS